MDLSAVGYVYMPVKMELWANFHYLVVQSLAASILIFDRFVQYSERRTVSHQDINVLWNAIPKFISIFCSIQKAIIITEVNRIRRAKDLDSLDLDRFVLKICADFL